MKKLASTVTAIVLALAGPAQAATVTWNGDDTGGDQNWTPTDSTSWSSATYTNGDTAQFLGSGAGTVNVDAGGVLPGGVIVNSSASYTFSGGSIGGSGTLTNIGSGVLTLSNHNTYSGGTRVGIGGGPVATLKLGIDNALPIGGAVTVDSSGASVLNLNGFNQTIGLLSMGSNNGGTRGYVTNTTGSSTLTLSNGVLCANHNNGGGGIFCTALDLNGTNQTFTVQNGIAVPDLLVSSVIQNGSLTMDGVAATMGLSATNTYSGPTKVIAGVLELSNFLAMQNSPLDTSGAGTVSLNNGSGSYTLGGLKGSKNLSSVITGNPTYLTSLVLNPGAGVTNTYSGIIPDLSSGMTLVKTGAGTQILSGTNTYSGNTFVNAGTLRIDGSKVFADAASLYITNNAFVYLGSGVNEAVTNLYLNGLQAQAGTWGSTSSSARYRWDKSFAGTGILTVLAGTGISPSEGLIITVR